MIIGVIGTNGAGKDEVANFLKGKGFAYYSCSDIIREECEYLKIPKDRDNLIRAGNELRKKFGNGVLAKKILEKIKKNNIKNAVIVSIRNPSELQEVKKQGGFMISVDAPISVRYERITKRKREGDSVSFEKFKGQEEGEMRSHDNSSQQLRMCLDLADYKIINDSTILALHKKIADILKERKFKV